MPKADKDKHQDPEHLPGAEYPTNGVYTPEDDMAEGSADFTLSEEGEGDNLSGHKELLEESEHEDESNSKRPKVPLHPLAAE